MTFAVVMIIGLAALTIWVGRMSFATHERGLLVPLSEIEDSPQFDYLSRGDGSTPVPYKSHGTMLVEQRGNNLASLSLDIPADCFEQLLEVTGWRDDATHPYSWIQLESEDEDTGPHTTIYPIDLTHIWALPPGEHTLIVGGENVRWLIAVSCR
jgi:hypothetical protein